MFIVEYIFKFILFCIIFFFLELSDDDDDIDDILEGCEVLNKNDEEIMEEYFERIKDFWIE